MKSKLIIFLFTASLMLRAQVPTTSLVAYYPFTGNANDLSGNGNNGTLINGPTLTTDRFGNLNSAYNFVGSSFQEIQVPANSSLQPANAITMAAWVYLTSTSTWGVALCKRFDANNDPYNSYALGLNTFPSNSKWCASMSNGVVGSQAVAVPGTNAPLNQWMLIVGTYDGANLKFYQNGVLVATTPKTGNIGYSNLPFRIGAAVNGQNMTGKIDDVRIYSRALSDCEVLELYNEGTPDPLGIAPSSVTMCSGASAVLTASGATTYSWAPNTALSATVGANVTANPTSSITYTVSGTNSAGCVHTKTVGVTVNPLPTISISGTNAICSGNSTNLTASGANTYTWNTNAQSAAISISPASNTTYTVTGTDGNGCQNAATKTVSVITTPTASASSSGSITCVNPNVTLTGSGVTTFTWTGPGIVSGANSANATVNSPGTYNLAGSSNGCTSANTSVNVLMNVTAPNVTISSSTTTICQGNSVTLTANGAGAYNWNTGATTSNISVSPSSGTTYTVTGTSAVNGCTASATQAINVNALPSVAITGVNAICNGNTATLTAGGANTYLWNTSANTAAINVSPSTTTSYTVTGTSAAGCTNTAVKTLTVNANPALTAASSSVTCFGSCNGSITANATGNGPFNYNYIPAGPTNLCAGAYTVMVTDANNCSSNAVVNLSQPAALSSNASASPAVICSGNSSTLNVVGSGGSGALSYSWTTGTNGQTTLASPTVSSTYTATVTDGNGCVKTSTVNVAVNASPVTPTITPLGLQLSSSSSTGNQWYLNGSAISGATAQNYNMSSNGNYMVCVSNSNLCQSCSQIYNMQTVGISELQTSNSELLVYPNPTSGIVTIAALGKGTIKVYNSLGQIVITQELTHGNNNLDMTELATGVYYIKSPYSSIIKIVKQ